MSWKLPAGFALFASALLCANLPAQQPSNHRDPSPTAAASLSPVPLEWVPPALIQLNTLAVTKSSFTLDRNMLSAAAALVPDSEPDDRAVIRKLEGVSVHTMRFNADGIPNQSAVDSIRAAYHLRGWKHVVTTTAVGGPLHNGTTDVWVVMDGVNVRGAVVLSETPRSLTLVTVAGNLDPVDILHLRGHFGIPAFDSTALGTSHLQ
jgi:hypothetical protein